MPQVVGKDMKWLKTSYLTDEYDGMICVPQNSYAKVLTLSNSEGDYIWGYVLWRAEQVEMRSLEVGPDLTRSVSLEERD